MLRTPGWLNSYTQTQFYVSASKSSLFEKGMAKKQLWPYAVNKQIEFDDELQETGILPVEKDNIPKPLGNKGYIRVDEHFKYLGAYTEAQMVQPQKNWTIYNACVLATLLYKRIKKKDVRCLEMSKKHSQGHVVTAY